MRNGLRRRRGDHTLESMGGLRSRSPLREHRAASERPDGHLPSSCRARHHPRGGCARRWLRRAPGRGCRRASHACLRRERLQAYQSKIHSKIHITVETFTPANRPRELRSGLPGVFGCPLYRLVVRCVFFKRGQHRPLFFPGASNSGNARLLLRTLPSQQLPGPPP